MSGDINKKSNFKRAQIWIMFLFYVLSLNKKGDTIQGGTLFKGGHYLRKYGIGFISMLFVCFYLPGHFIRLHSCESGPHSLPPFWACFSTFRTCFPRSPHFWLHIDHWDNVQSTERDFVRLCSCTFMCSL